MKRHTLRVLMIEDGLEMVRVPRRKKSKYQKLDPNNLIEAEMIRRRKKAIQKKLRALQ